MRAMHSHRHAMPCRWCLFHICDLSQSMRLKWPKWLSIILKPKEFFISVAAWLSIYLVYTYMYSNTFIYLNDDQQYEYVCICILYADHSKPAALKQLPITRYSSSFSSLDELIQFIWRCPCNRPFFSFSFLLFSSSRLFLRQLGLVPHISVRYSYFVV